VALFGAQRQSRRFSLIVPGGFAVNALMHVARKIDNDGPAAARFRRDFHRAFVGSVFGGVAGLTKAARRLSAFSKQEAFSWPPARCRRDRGIIE
jgi:hypothetical protein